MYKDKDANWKNYCPEMNSKFHNLYTQAKDKNETKFYIDFPITSNPKTHKIDLKNMSAENK